MNEYTYPIIEIGADILATERNETNGSLSAQLGDVIASDETGDAEIWQQVGFASRPPKAAPGTAAAQCVIVRQGDSDAIIASRDSRAQQMAGSLKEGETCLYAPGPESKGMGRIMLKDDGSKSSVTIYTTKGNADGGLAVMITISSEGTVSVVAGDNGAISIDEKAITMLNKGSGLSLGADGTITMSGKVIILGGNSILLGNGAKATTPVCVGPVGQSAIGSKSVLCAP